MLVGLKKTLDELRDYIDDPTKGLPEEVFLFATEIVPMTNVDLLVRDDLGRVLLAWRNDPWWGSGWHVPGGIIRLKETFEERIQRTAEAELHSAVTFKEKPLETVPIIAKEFKQRGHHITFVYDCKVPDDYRVNNGNLREQDTGFLAWHDTFPTEMLRCHEFYRKYFKE